MSEADYLAERARVDAWIATDLEVAMGESEYGRSLYSAWQASSRPIGRLLEDSFAKIPSGLGLYNMALTGALRSGEADSYYKAMLMQALALVQAADRAKNGVAIEKVRITFLPSNTRYAAIYEPYVAKGWLVIGIDWGMLCATMTVAAVVSHCLQGRFEPGRSEISWLLTPESAIAHFDAHPKLMAMWVEGLTPAIIPSLPPVAPQFPTEPHRSAFGVMLLKAMIFGLVAHEYGHAMRNHMNDERRATELRAQIEHEADAMSIFLAMCDPWKVLARTSDEYIPHQRYVAVASCLLLQSMLKHLQIGDRMVDDLTGRRPRTSTHPDPIERFRALRQIIDLIVPAGSVQRREIDRFSSFLINLLDGIWNRSTGALFGHLQQQRELQVTPAEAVRGSELKFL